MFGYIRVFQPELTYREYEQYRGIYCSLCEALGKRYGAAARMTLSYDFTFLAMFRMALLNEQPTFTVGRCPFRPAKKRAFCDPASVTSLDYAADTAMILTYYKLSDTVCDERFFKKIVARISRRLLSRDFKKAVSRRPQEASWAKEFMNAQTEVEGADHPSLDAAAHPTAVFLSKLASASASEDDRDTAERFGYCLGRFIYMADAADDAEDDKKHGSFNAYVQAFPHDFNNGVMGEELREYISQSLHNTVAVCTECYEQLPITCFDSIMRNILYCGLPSVIHRIQHSPEGGASDEKSV